MKHRRATVAMAAAAFLGTGAAVTAGPAQAAPAVTIGTFYFFADGTGIPCLTANGVGNQLTVTNNGVCAKITETALGNNIVQLKDGNGNCLRANNSHVVLIENGPCNTQDNGEVWNITHSNPNRFENVKQALWMKVTGTSSGDKVWVGTGGITNWELTPLS
jgi:hypothetical protein